MAQKVLKIGPSAGVTLPKRVMEELGIKVGDRVVVETDKSKSGFVVRPIAKLSKQDKKIAELTSNFVERYRADLEALARK